MNQSGIQISLSQQAYRLIRHKIVTLELEPGAVIDEAALRSELDLGRTPIREALQRLALEKLVSIVPRRGMFVTEIGITDLQRLFEMRVVLEGKAAELAALRGSAAHWDEMDQLLSDLPEPTDQANNLLLIEIDEACHQIIYDAADNEFLADTLNMLFALSLRLWHFSLAQVADMEGAVTEHQRILEALRAKEGEQAAALMAKHIQQFQAEIQAVMLGVRN